MKTTNVISSFAASLMSIAVFAAGPGGGGTPPGGGGNQPGGNQPGGGSSGTWTFDTFLASSTITSGLIIREGAITGYASPTAVTVASSVSDIAAGALAGCTTLTSIDLSATSITSIPDDAFSGCTALTTVVLPSSCTSIGANAFSGCTSLVTLTASGTTSIGDDAFRGCTALTTIPSSVTTLGDYAFAQSGLTSVSVGTGMTIGEGAFAGCESLAAADWGQSALPNAVFAGCTALNVGDWSGVTTFGTASLAGIPATSLTLSTSASLGAYALAADEATVTTTLSNSSLPTFADTTWLGREVSYTPVAGSVARIEAADLVEWLIADSESVSPSVTQPSDYNTATLKTWLATGNNAFSYAYAAEIADDTDFIALNVKGSSFTFQAPASTSLAVSVEPVACYTLSSDESDWSADNLVWSEDDGAYVAADDTQTSCFARLRFYFNW